MTYASGGLIEDIDYNGFSSTNSPNINATYGQGTGDAGYGQTAVSTVSDGQTITAPQWATLLNAVNATRKHQAGVSHSNLTVPVTGDVITYLSALSGNISTAYTNRLTFATQGATPTRTTDSTNPTAGATTILNYFRDINIPWDSSDQARYFFNSGGRLNLVFSATDNASTTRSQAARDVINSIGGINNIGPTTNGGRTGTGNNLTTSNTSFGYYNLVFNSPTNIIVVYSSAAAYSNIHAYVQFFAGNSDTTRGSKGNIFVIRCGVYAPADDAYGGAINLTFNVRCDLVLPETTFLSNSWGGSTITFDSA